MGSSSLLQELTMKLALGIPRGFMTTSAALRSSEFAEVEVDATALDAMASGISRGFGIVRM
jgi:hypothetical protein